MMIDPALRPAIDAAKRHAREMFPREMCGFIIDGVFKPVENAAPEPSTHIEDGECGCQLCAFMVTPRDTIEHMPKAQLFLHSHPNGPLYPSLADMQSQIQSNIPWGVISLDEDRIGDPIIWGDGWPMSPLLGRSFMHGVTDCFSLIRDTFRLGREECAKQDIDWPFDPIEMDEQPRDPEWWNKDFDLYTDNFAKLGWRQITMKEAKPGDGFLLSVNSKKLNHGGLLVGGGMIMHHLPLRLSRREPSGIWARHAAMWLRYEGAQ